MIFYNKYCTAATDSFSPSSRKPALVVQDWAEKFPDVHVKRSGPATLADLYRAHCQDYVDGVLTGLRLNGFDNTDSEIATSLPFTVGAMTEAAVYAFENKTWAVAPVSGFHHAHYDRAEGFCTFNGLIVAAQAALEAGAKTVAIIDLDQHYGNGTQDIINRLGLEDQIGQYSEAVHWSEADRWLDALPEIVATCCDAADLILYQAGADSHINDPLGGYLTTEQMQVRDRIVFSVCQDKGAPVAWNLAGGYQANQSEGLEPVLALHRATMTECLKAWL